MDKIRDNLYLGSSSDGLHRKEQLKKAGITAILNVARDLTNTTTTHEEFQLYHIGLMDGGGNYGGLFLAAVETLATLIKNGHKVLVHCHEGKSRSALIVAIYLVTYEGLYRDIDEAEERLREIRPRVQINPELKEDYFSGFKTQFLPLQVDPDGGLLIL